MAGRGPAPKNPSDRARRNADPSPSIYVEADGKLHGPELPASPVFVIGRGDDAKTYTEWPAATVAWWDNWRRSAQAKTFTPTAWASLLDTAVLHAEFWLGSRALASELRLRESKFGATPDDLLRLRMAVGKPPEAGNAAPAAKPGEQGGRRDRILSLVEDAG